MPDTDIDKESASSSQPLSFRLPPDALPERLDKVIARLIPHHSRSLLQTWIQDGHVLVNGEGGRNKQTVHAGDTILVWLQTPPQERAFSPEPIPLDIIAESEGWLVVNKPAGLVTHPGAGNWHGTLLNGLLHRFPELRSLERAGIVHRLDKDTSGLLVVARDARTQAYLVQQLQARTVRREYRALVHGHVIAAGVVDQAVGRDPRVPVRMTTDRPVAARQAITHYVPLRRGVALDGEPVTELRCQLETGRTHQIRVHMKWLGHPLVSDVLYGGKPLVGAERQLLHAFALSFDDAVGRHSFEAPLAADFSAVLNTIEWAEE